MHNRIIKTLLLIFALNVSIQAQVKKYDFGDSIFVWASNLKMREGPSPDAKIVGKVAYGSAVVIVDDEIGKVAYKYKAVEKQKKLILDKTTFYLKGEWVKANYWYC